MFVAYFYMLHEYLFCFIFKRDVLVHRTIIDFSTPLFYCVAQLGPLSCWVAAFNRGLTGWRSPWLQNDRNLLQK